MRRAVVVVRWVVVISCGSTNSTWTPKVCKIIAFHTIGVQVAIPVVLGGRRVIVGVGEGGAGEVFFCDVSCEP